MEVMGFKVRGGGGPAATTTMRKPAVPSLSSIMVTVAMTLSLLAPPSSVYAQPPIYIGVTDSTANNEYGCSIMDGVTNYGYFGTTTVPGKVVKIDMKAAGDLPAWVATLTLNAGEGKE